MSTNASSVCRGHAGLVIGKRPLSGERLVIVAPGGELGTELDRCGAEVVEIPLPVTPAARVVLGALPITGCILRSPEEAEGLDEEKAGPGWDSSKVVAWSLSPAASERARLLGWRNVVQIPEETPDAVIRAIMGNWCLQTPIARAGMRGSA